MVVLDGGRIGLSELKKLERLLDTAGEGGNWESVSMVLSDKDGRGLLDDPPSSMASLCGGV